MANEIFKQGKTFAEIGEEANAKFDEIDAQIDDLSAEIPDAIENDIFVFGVYTGDGETKRTISLGFTPVAVEVYCCDESRYSNPKIWGGLALDDHPVLTYNSTDHVALSIVENGFNVYYNSGYDVFTNSDGSIYHFKAYKVGTIDEYE